MIPDKRFWKSGEELHAPCEHCSKWEGKVARVFPSEDAFKNSDFYGGADIVANDELAEFPAWPGKNNVNFSPGNWRITCPVHPWCDHHWEPVVKFETNDWFADLDVEKFTVKHDAA